MADMQRNEEEPVEGATPLPFVLRLGSVKACRQSMTRLVREYGKGRVDSTTFRTTVWALGQLVTYWRLEKDLEIEKRIEALESKLEGNR